MLFQLRQIGIEQPVQSVQLQLVVGPMKMMLHTQLLLTIGKVRTGEILLTLFSDILPQIDSGARRHSLPQLAKPCLRPGFEQAELVIA